METGEVVAIKKVRVEKKWKSREVELMRVLRHPNVVKLKHSFYTRNEEVLSALLL